MTLIDTLKRGQRHARVLQTQHPGLRHELVLCDDGLTVRSHCLGPSGERLEHHHVVGWAELEVVGMGSMIETLLDRQLRELRARIAVLVHPWGVTPR